MSIPFDACKICGGKRWTSHIYKDCPEHDGVCGNCAIWELHARNPSRKTIIDGHQYFPGNRVIGPDLGMAGRRFDIEYFDGRRITTFDLWSGGKIPDHWRDRLQDNARFLNGAHEAQAGETTCWNASDYRDPPYPLPNEFDWDMGGW